MVRLVGAFSLLGQHGAVWLGIGLVGERLDAGRAAAWRRGWHAVLGAYGVNQALKLLVRRPRPANQRVATPTGLSFPSAHATTSFAGARAYGRLLPAGPLYALAGALALSRLYLRVHHPTDVLAGAALGYAAGGLAWR